MSPPDYQLIRLANGTHSVRSVADAETFHPGIGPAAEAEALYVRQLRLPGRLRETEGDFVLWDVGLGAAANALTAIRLLREARAAQSDTPCPAPLKTLRIVSFDRTTAASAFALQHGAELGYVQGFENLLSALIEQHSARQTDARLNVEWTLILGDFPAFVQGHPATCLHPSVPAPHAILFDPHSPGKNPAMWTVPFFADLFRALDPQRPCALATFTRSTLARTALLLGGFHVGTGHASGMKEETTVAANRLELLAQPLDPRWLERAKRSGSAEPLREAVYRQAPLSPETWEQLRQHPQFRRNQCPP